MRTMLGVLVGLLWMGCSSEKEMRMDSSPLQKTEAQWREELTPEQYRILRQAGTERPFSGLYTDCEDVGVYRCAGCGATLFSSTSKYHSGCGWPAFDAALADEKVVQREDRSLGVVRIEVLCATCGGHLGHLFPDGPPETTGMRYCINSAALELEKTETEESSR